LIYGQEAWYLQYENNAVTNKCLIDMISLIWMPQRYANNCYYCVILTVYNKLFKAQIFHHLSRAHLATTFLMF